MLSGGGTFCRRFRLCCAGAFGKGGFWNGALSRNCSAPRSVCAGRRGAIRPTRRSNAVDINRVLRFSFRMNIYRSLKFSTDGAAEIAPIKCGLPGTGFFRVPAQRAKPARVSFAIASTRPGRYLAGFGMIIPDQRFTVFCALINPVPERDVRQEQKRRTVNRQESFAHRSQFTIDGKYPGRPATRSPHSLHSACPLFLNSTSYFLISLARGNS